MEKHGPAGGQLGLSYVVGAVSDECSIIEAQAKEIEKLRAQASTVVHGRWIERRASHAMGGISAKCSACSKSVQYLGNPLNYCPNCGAKMDGGADNACL